MCQRLFGVAAVKLIDMRPLGAAAPEESGCVGFAAGRGGKIIRMGSEKVIFLLFS